MEVLIVYQSFFGNTEKVAAAIRDSLGSHKDTELVEVAKFEPFLLEGVEYLIVGSPTRKFSFTGGIKKLFERIPRDGLKGVRVAAFDTRIGLSDIESRMLRFMARIFGYAATPLARKLEKKGGELVVAPEGFLVAGMKGPLKQGELERASRWAIKVIGD